MKNNFVDLRPREYFNHGYAQMVMYLRDHSDVNIKASYLSQNGFPLGAWLIDVRNKWREGKLTSDQTEKLELLGISIYVDIQSWEMMYYHAEKVIAKNGINRISLHEKTEDGIMIGAWLDRQRRIYRTLTTEQQTKLNKIGIYEYGNTVI